MVCDFIDCTKLDNPNLHLIKQILVNALCEYFTLIGETFCGSQSPELNMKLSQKQSKYVDQIHNNTLEALKSSLETEIAALQKDSTQRVTDLEMKPARQWEKVVGGIVAAVALAVVAYFLGKLGLPM